MTSIHTQLATCEALRQQQTEQNDENYYTDYRYQLTAQLGTWQKTIGVSTASLHPGNPVSYQFIR